ncbi:MAG TPA: hypothetical protein VJ997_01685 [Longimicrobiales bacterium]|nr:hypothetical protein [Longimicrobiales bacterium]
MNRATPLAVLALVAALVATPLTAQAPDPDDVSSIDGIIAAVYDVISGPAGQARDWDRWRSLFMDGARLIPVGRAQDGSVGHRVMTPEEYVSGAGGLERNGFFEQEIGRVQESFGQIAHLFSTYESRRNRDDAQPFARGINSFQLFNDGTRWWVVSIMWNAEGPGNPIPARYIR